MIELLSLSLFASIIVSALFIPGLIAIRTDRAGLRVDRYTYGGWVIIFGILVFGAMVGSKLNSDINKIGWANVDWLGLNLPIVFLCATAVFILFPFAGWFFPRVIFRRVADAGWPVWLAYVGVTVPLVNALIWFFLLFPSSKLDNGDNSAEIPR